MLLHGVLGKDELYWFNSFQLQHPPSPHTLGPATSRPSQVFSSAFSPSLHISVTNSPISVSCSGNHASCNKKKEHCTFELWHNRLGHASEHVVSHILNQCKIQISNKMLVDVCKACCLGKAHHLPSLPSPTTYTFPLELVFTNLWGPAPMVSSQGYRYYIAFVDAFSRFTWVYFLKTKSEAFQAFLQFKASVELQLGHRIKAFQSNSGGGEFRPFSQFFQINGITHRIIFPHTHHQNGTIERKHRHLTEVGLTLLAQASMPLKFWDDAVATATHIIN